MNSIQFFNISSYTDDSILLGGKDWGINLDLIRLIIKNYFIKLLGLCIGRNDFNFYLFSFAPCLNLLASIVPRSLLLIEFRKRKECYSILIMGLFISKPFLNKDFFINKKV